MINNSEKIGGPGVIVEIDESKFGKSNNIFIFYDKLAHFVLHIFDFLVWMHFKINPKFAEYNYCASLTMMTTRMLPVC